MTELTDTKALYIIEQFIYLMNSIESTYQHNLDEITLAELETTDLEHEIEFTNFGASDGFKIYKQFQEVRRRRRIHKNQNEVLRYFRKFASTHTELKGELKQLVGHMNNMRKEQKERVYNARVLKGLRCCVGEACVKS